MEPDSHPRDRLRRVLSLNDATMLIVASVVGSGIFLTPAAIAGGIQPDVLVRREQRGFVSGCG